MIYGLLYLVKNMKRKNKTKKLFMFFKFYFFMSPQDLQELILDQDILDVVS
jgi:hypothetical protein